MWIALFGFGCFTLGFVAGIVPRIVEQHFYTKNMMKLEESDKKETEIKQLETKMTEWARLIESVAPDEEDIKEEQKKEESEYGFFA